MALKRTLSAKDVIILTMSALSPAASVYITGSGILHMAGTGAAAALLIGGPVAIIASLLYAELGAAFPRAGGVYPGIANVLGQGPAFVAITLILVTAPATLAFLAMGLSDYIRALAPGLPKLPIALAALGGAALLAILNIRISAWVTAAFLATEMAGLVVLPAAVGLHPLRGLGEVLLHPVMLGPAHRLIPTPIWTMMLAAISGSFACSGSGLALYFAEDIHEPPQRIGRVVVVIGVLAAIVVSTPLVLLATSNFDPAGMLSAEAPISYYLKTATLPSLAYVVTLAVALAILNTIIANMIAFSRFLYATGRDGIWPKAIDAWISSIHLRFGSPWLASCALGLSAGALCLIGERRLLIVISGETFTAAMVAASVLIGRRRKLTGALTFRSPLFPFLPLLGFVIIVAFMAADWHDLGAGRPSLLLLSLIAICAMAYYRFIIREK